MPSTYNKLVENIKLNKLNKNVYAHNLGVAARKGKRKLYLDKTSPFHSMYISTGKYQQIKCTTLKHIFIDNKIKKCDLLKMDCEGAEFEILLNTPQKFLKKIREIRLEYHEYDKSHRVDDLVEFLNKSNFKIVKFKKETNNSGLIFLKRSLIIQ
jgi:FkbM family methyltransferase